MTALYPLTFRPVFRDYLWGGRRLATTLKKQLADNETAAESWEVVDHGADQSVVASGPLAGKTLNAIVREFPKELFGVDCTDSGGALRVNFPLLLKYLDCQRDLSVQVHPDDSYAATMPVPDRGKTEAWYIVDAQPGSLIYAGLRAGVGASELAAAVEAGRTAEVLHAFEPAVGDCVLIPAGTVHALGAGLLVAEIQQASDTTFRLFDWNRVDAHGNARPLHIDQALAVTDYDLGPVNAVTPKNAAGPWQQMVDCEKFRLNRAAGKGTHPLNKENQFAILTVPRGSAMVRGDGPPLSLAIGESALIPAEMPALEIELEDNQSVVLSMQLPTNSLTGTTDRGC